MHLSQIQVSLVGNHLENIKQDIRRTEELLEDKKKQMQIYRIRVSSMLEAQLKILNEDEDLK